MGPDITDITSDNAFFIKPVLIGRVELLFGLQMPRVLHLLAGRSTKCTPAPTGSVRQLSPLSISPLRNNQIFLWVLLPKSFCFVQWFRGFPPPPPNLVVRPLKYNFFLYLSSLKVINFAITMLYFFQHLTRFNQLIRRMECWDWNERIRQTSEYRCSGADPELFLGGGARG